MKIFISPRALLKMQALVMGYDKEVGWWGTVEKIKSEEYRIKDILVFPQYTGAAYIDDEAEDPLEMSKWLDSLSDEVFNEKRFFGHSHVNMGVYFSPEDSKMFDRQVDVIKRASVNNYYLSVVLNKRGEMYWKAWDGETDKEYEGNEIEIMFEVEDGLTNIDFFENSKKMVKDLKRKSSNSLIFGGGHKTYTPRTYEYSTYKYEPKIKTLDKTDFDSYSKQIEDEEDFFNIEEYEDNEEFENLYALVEILSNDISVRFCGTRDLFKIPEIEDFKKLKTFDVFGSDTKIAINEKVEKLDAKSLCNTLFELVDDKNKMIVLSTEKGQDIDIDCLMEKDLCSLLRRTCVIDDEGVDYVLITVKGDFNEHK